MSVQFKAYLYEGRPCRSKEVRRFSIDHDVSASYEYLRRKVASVFPNIADNFSLQWKDQDGDFIWFNSDEELMQALSQHSGNEFKLFIKEQNSEGSSSPRCGPKFGGQKFSRCSPPFGFVHPGLFGGFPAYTCETGQKMETDKEKPTTSSSQEKNQSSDQDYLQEMGNFVSEFLKPFGVDVDIKVDHKNEKEKKDETKPPSEPNTSSAEKTTPKAADEPTTSSSPPPSSSQWTIIDNESKQANKDDDVSMEVEEDAKLREALDRLLSMGFNDHGGWLTNLLKASDCDIGRALDAMQPHRSRKN